MAQIVTLEVKAGFKMTYEPAGRAELNIEGEMDIPAVEDVIRLLEQIVGRLRKKIEEARERLTPDEQPSVAGKRKTRNSEMDTETMTAVAELYKLRDPHALPMIIQVVGDSVRAIFPALDCEGVSFNPDHWKARDEAIFSCAKAIVAKFEMGLSHEHSGSQQQRRQARIAHALSR